MSIGYRIILLYFFLLVGVIPAWAKPVAPVTIVFQADQDDNEIRINAAFPDAFHATTITYTTDVYLQESEFFYLLGKQPGDLICAFDIARAVSYFFKKNKFETITIARTVDEQGSHLHISFASFWTFSKLKLQGILLGKYLYQSYYLLEPGERFDQEKHELSMEKIKAAFTAQGYCNGEVSSRIERDMVTKSVTVYLSLRKGDKYSIGQVCLNLDKGECLQDAESASLHDELYHSFLKKITRNSYNKKLINDQMSALKKYLFNRGLIHVSISLREVINHELKTIDLLFDLELHHKKEFVFVGNNVFSTRELTERIALFGRSAWLLPMAMVQQDINDMYEKKGFWHAQVEAKEESDRCIFYIKEGNPIQISQAILEGAHTFSEQYLIKKFFSSLLKKKQYDADAYEAAVQAMVDFYVQEGFLEMKVVARDFKQIGSSDAYEFNLTIAEGDRSYLTHLSIEGFADLESQGPFADYKKEQLPIPFDSQMLMRQRQWLVDYFYNQGYTHAVITPELKRDKQMVSVVWSVQTGPKVCFGKTVIMGSTKFPFEYMMRELCYQEGEVWNKQQLKCSMLSLKELGVFDSIYLYPYRSSVQEPENTIILKAQKDDPFELRLRLGCAAQQVSKSLHTAGFTYRAGGSFLIKNPFNYADQLLFEGDVTRSQRKTLIRYSRPWIFDIPMSSIFQGYSNRYEQPGLLGSIKNLYQVTQQGFLMGVVGKYTHAESSFNTGIEWMQTKVSEGDSDSVRELDNLVHAINFTPRLLDKNIPYLLIEPTLLLDYSDNRLDPTQGSFTLFSLKSMVPIDRFLSQAYFVKFLIEQSLFTSIRSVVCAVRVRIGHIFNDHLKNIVPIERFYLGGANSIRSYETDRCPPLGVFVDSKGCRQYVPRGGKTLANINLEVRFPVYKNIRGVVFQDAGMLSGNFFRRNEEYAILAGTGFGVRYGTPVGPIRIDIAWKWKRSHPNELPYAWFMTLGHAF